MRALIVVLALLSVPTSAAAQEDRPAEPPPSAPAAASADEAALRELPERWIRLYNAGDATAVAALYAEDAYYLSAHVLAHGRREIAAYFQRGIDGGGHLDWIRPIEIVREGNLAYFIGRYQATNAGVTVDGRLLIVLRKVGGTWLMAAHETVVRDM